jgi:hypothetical protein
MTQTTSLPTPWSDAELAEKDFGELRARLQIYAEEAERLEDLYNTKTNEFNAREVVYVRVFGALAVVNESRDILFGSLLNTKSLAADESLAKAIAQTSLVATIGLGIKAILMLDKLNDLHNAGKTFRETAAIVKRTGTADDIAEVAAKATANASKIKNIRAKSVALGLLTLGVGVVTLIRAKQSEMEAAKQMREAFPTYLEFFDDVNESIALLEGGIATMNSAINTLIAETGVGSEASLLQYMKDAIGSIATFRSLYDSAVAMLEDRNSASSSVVLSNADIARYTGLPEDYIDTIEQGL